MNVPALCLVLWLALPLYGQVQDARIDALEQWTKIPTQKERSRILGQLSDAELQKLKYGTDDSLSLQAAWKLITDSLHRARGSKPEFHDPAPLAYFVGFVEGRSEVGPPLWFSKTILTSCASANFVPHVVPREVIRPRRLVGKQEEVLGMVRSATDIRIDQNGDRVQIRLNETAVNLPEAVVRKLNGGLSGDLDCWVEANRAYVSWGNSSTAGEHDVCCIDLEANSLVWQSKTCAGYYGAVGGYSEGFHEIRVSKERVFIFCAAHVGFFLHSFDTKTGRTLQQFSTDFSP